MVYAKSVLAGIIALVVASVLYVYLFFALWVRPRLPKVRPGVVGVDARLIFGRPFFWLVALLSFAVAFYWEFRRASI